MIDAHAEALALSTLNDLVSESASEPDRLVLGDRVAVDLALENNYSAFLRECHVRLDAITAGMQRGDCC